MKRIFIAAILLFSIQAISYAAINDTIIEKQPYPIAISKNKNHPPKPYTAVFNHAFQKRSNGRSDINAYLLAYLQTLIYPENLKIAFDQTLDTFSLHTSPQYFEAEYKKAVEDLFYDQSEVGSSNNQRPQIKFISKDNHLGYDPEAMLISTGEVVYVIFRGTDRVGNAKDKWGYEWAEWLKSDLDFSLTKAPYGIPGNVHKGFWQSLELICDKLADEIIGMGGREKKIWITGHSLGSGHAQLFSAYLLKQYSIKPQGLYLFASPRAGDRDFVRYLETKMDVGSIQRFDFLDDPVTVLGPLPGNEPVGIRNYYNDINTYEYNANERNFFDETRLLISALASTGLTSLNDLIGKKVGWNIGSGDFCFHNPYWYLQAAFKQLSSYQKTKVPRVISPKSLQYCSSGAMLKGIENKSIIDQALETAEDILEGISYNIDQLVRNVNGTAVPEGSYYIRCAKGKKYLSWDRIDGKIQNGSRVDLENRGGWYTDNKFTIQRDGYSYIIKSQGKLVDVKAETLLNDYPKIQMWDAAGLFGSPGDNQRWFFYKIPGTTDKYIIRAAGISGRLKVLGARDRCTGQNNCGVRLEDGENNDLSQVWILKKR